MAGPAAVVLEALPRATDMASRGGSRERLRDFDSRSPRRNEVSGSARRFAFGWFVVVGFVCHVLGMLSRGGVKREEDFTLLCRAPPPLDTPPHTTHTPPPPFPPPLPVLPPRVLGNDRIS